MYAFVSFMTQPTILLAIFVVYCAMKILVDQSKRTYYPNYYIYISLEKLQSYIRGLFWSNYQTWNYAFRTNTNLLFPFLIVLSYLINLRRVKWTSFQFQTSKNLTFLMSYKFLLICLIINIKIVLLCFC